MILRLSQKLNEKVKAGKLPEVPLADDMASSEIGYRLNETPMSALVGPDGRKYGCPKEVFKRLVQSLDDG